MKCENCIHFDVCLYKPCLAECPLFKDKSLFVELPCKVGETLYFLYNRPYADKPDLTPKIYETNDWYFDIDKEGIAILTRDIHSYNKKYYYHLGETVFFTKEEAEAKLKEFRYEISFNINSA